MITKELAKDIIELLSSDPEGAEKLIGSTHFARAMTQPQFMAKLLNKMDLVECDDGVLTVGHYVGGGQFAVHVFSHPSRRGKRTIVSVRKFFKNCFRKMPDAMILVGKVSRDNKVARSMAIACGMKPVKVDDVEAWYEVRRG